MINNCVADPDFDKRLEAAKQAYRESLKDVPVLRYFKPDEFKECTPSCSIEDMDREFLLKLDDARAICSFPFILNSAYRSDAYEKAHSRHLDGIGAHSKGCAVDISCITSVCRLKMIMALLAVGFRRIGIYPTFIHVDSDCSKPPSLWYGK